MITVTWRKNIGNAISFQTSVRSLVCLPLSGSRSRYKKPENTLPPSDVEGDEESQVVGSGKTKDGRR